MAKICLCLTGDTLEKDRELVEKYRGIADIAELRVDYLSPDERYYIRKFPKMAGIPCILTIRRDSDGGQFRAGEWERVSLLAKGLAFAESDHRHNFAYIDMESDLSVPGVEEAARVFGTRIIRSFHNIHGTESNIAEKIRKMRRDGDEIVKFAVTPATLEEAHAVLRAAKETTDLEKILVCMGRIGFFSRILADKFGSLFTYSSLKGNTDFPQPAAYQAAPEDLADFYRIRNIDSQTRIFGVSGFPLNVTSSPYFFNTVFKHERINAVCLPFPAESIEAFLSLAEDIGLSGASITIPHKETLLPFLSDLSENVRAASACNTIVRGENGWQGFNTDVTGFSDSLLHFFGQRTLKGCKVTIIGAGGAARSVASELRRLKATALILNRSARRARDTADAFGFQWAELDKAGIALIDKFNDIIIQTTSVGMEPDIKDDPIAAYNFTGKEVVMDIIYKPKETALLRRASNAKCRVLNGEDMFKRQAQHQYRLFIGRDVPSDLMSELEL